MNLGKHVHIMYVDDAVPFCLAVIHSFQTPADELHQSQCAHSSRRHRSMPGKENKTKNCGSSVGCIGDPTRSSEQQRKTATNVKNQPSNQPTAPRYYYHNIASLRRTHAHHIHVDFIHIVYARPDTTLAA